jgi:hypothetical protein
MAEQRLRRPDVLAIFDQVCREAVAEGVATAYLHKA